MGSGSGCDVDRDDCKELIRRKSPINGDKIGDKEGGYQIQVSLSSVGQIGGVHAKPLPCHGRGLFFCKKRIKNTHVHL